MLVSRGGNTNIQLATSMALIRIAVLLLAVVAGATAAPLPYNEGANAPVEIERALAVAARTQKPVLLVFGANWCEDCRALDRALRSSRNAALIAEEFLVVKIDVGNFDRNLALSARYGNPIKGGIPAAVVLSPSNEVRYATRAGELSNARAMSATGVYEFFRTAASAANLKK